MKLYRCFRGFSAKCARALLAPWQARRARYGALMEFPLALTFAALLCAASVVAQTAPPVSTPTPDAPAAAPAQDKEAAAAKILRALPVDNIPLPDLPSLPRTLPPEARVSYSQMHVPGNVIAITFDDGPHPQNTPRLLDMLKERGIKATFFLIGKSAATWPDVVKRIIAEGHEVANHTWTHPLLTHLSEAKVLDELQSTHDAITKACGTAPILYRPPYGAASMSQKKMIHEHFGYPTILWDVDPEDWRAPRFIAKVHDCLLKETRSGSIILCHDIHQPTVDAMPSTLDDLTARGFKFVTVTQLINLEVQTAKLAAAAAAAAPPEETIAKPASAAAPTGATPAQETTRPALPVTPPK